MSQEFKDEPEKRARYTLKSDQVLRKRVPPRKRKEPGDVFVTNKSNFKGQVAQCMKLITSTEVGYIKLFGLGAAIPRTINLANQVQEQAGPHFKTRTTTSTVRITDDIEGTNGIFEHVRQNSAITIYVYRSKEIGSNELCEGGSSSTSIIKDEPIKKEND